MPSPTLPRLLVTGFGPFPGAPKNPTEALVRSLAEKPAAAFGAREFRAIVLPTDYRRSWERLRRLYASFAPDVVVHFGLSGATKAIHVERLARNCAATDKADAAGYAPRSGRVARDGKETLATTLPVDAIVAALNAAGFPAAASNDAGAYVCNATLYRSLLASARSAPRRRVGFVHVPPLGTGWTEQRLLDAAIIILNAATGARSAQRSNAARRVLSASART